MPLADIYVDSAVYVYTAKRMLAGELLYLDLVDNKGPVLYLLNMLGLLIAGGNYWGIWLLEIAASFIASLYMFRTVNLFFSKKESVAAVLMGNALLFYFLRGGNFTESWSLPAIAGALYLFMKYVKYGTLKAREIVTISLLFVFAAMTRMNNAIIWVFFGLYIGIELLFKKRYARFFAWTALAAITIALAVAPFIIYACKKGIMEEAVFCVFKMNFGNLAPHAIFKQVVRFMIYPFGDTLCKVFCSAQSAVIIVYGAVVVFGKKIENRKVHILILGAMAATVIITNINQYIGHHFRILLTPMLAFAFALPAHKIIRTTVAARLTIIASLLFPVLLGSLFLLTTRKATKELAESLKAVSEYVRANTADDERILVPGLRDVVYLTAGRSAASRYHYTSPICFFEPHGSKIVDGYLCDIENNKPKLIVMSYPYADSRKGSAAMLAFIEARYEIARQTGPFRIMRIKQD